jgi:hypothetical protein
MSAMMGFIVRALWGEGYGGKFKMVDSEMLGIGLMDEEEIDHVARADALKEPFPYVQH